MISGADRRNQERTRAILKRRSIFPRRGPLVRGRGFSPYSRSTSSTHGVLRRGCLKFFWWSRARIYRPARAREFTHVESHARLLRRRSEEADNQRERERVREGKVGALRVKRGKERIERVASTEGRRGGTSRSWSDASATGAPARFVVEHVLDVVELSALAAPTGRPPSTGYDRSTDGGERGPLDHRFASDPRRSSQPRRSLGK